VIHLYGDVDEHLSISGHQASRRLLKMTVPAQASGCLNLLSVNDPLKTLRFKDDPWQMKNLAEEPNYDIERRRLRAQLNAYLWQTRDPRALGNGDVFDKYST
jgi:hypothetical protein